MFRRYELQYNFSREKRRFNGLATSSKQSELCCSDRFIDEISTGSFVDECHVGSQVECFEQEYSGSNAEWKVANQHIYMFFLNYRCHKLAFLMFLALPRESLFLH
jgi:hypothetical protein